MQENHLKIIARVLAKMQYAREIETSFEKGSAYAEAEGMLSGLFQYESLIRDIKNGKRKPKTS
jgi:hypothetical protein